MAHTYTYLLYHMLFSTKDRVPMLTPQLAIRLFPYMGGIVRELGGTTIAVNGPNDHVHLLMRLPARVSVATVAEKVKGGSSRWVHDCFADQRLFGWQEGYTAVTVSHDRLEGVRQYILGQQQHHGQVPLRDEMIAILKEHGIEWDERYLLD